MWRTLDHTADVALEVEASSWPELLAEAARAFGEWLTGDALDPALHRTERRVEVEGVDANETWVRFWRELLRLWTVEGFLAAEARVEADADRRAVRARIGCLSAGALDPAHCADVKAVTWHAARVERRAGDGGTERWSGTIVLDL